MFRIIAPTAGLLAALCLATSSQAAIVTKNFNLLSNEITLKAEVTYDDTVSSWFGTGSAMLTVNEFTTTLSNFTLPTLQVEFNASNGSFLFGGGATTALDSTIDDVAFIVANSLAWGYYAYPHAPADYLAEKSVTALSFNQDAYVPAAADPTVPEPSSLALVALAGLGLVGSRRRRA